MRRLFPVLTPLLFLTAMFCFPRCKKDRPQKLYSNIILYDKPLSVIKAHIQGKWKLQYEKGGLCSTCINYFQNVDFVWEFKRKNKITELYNDTILVNTTMAWVRDWDAYRGATYVMKFHDKGNVPWNYIIDNIHNDTLVLRDAYSSDDVSYYFTKF